MARPGITYDQVAAAANNIIAGGEGPQLRSIHEITEQNNKKPFIP